LSSDCSYVDPDIIAYICNLLTKHPPTPSNRRPTPQNTAVPCLCSIPQVLAALQSFAPGSAAGIDSLQPQHNKDMVQMSTPEGTCRIHKHGFLRWSPTTNSCSLLWCKVSRAKKKLWRPSSNLPSVLLYVDWFQKLQVILRLSASFQSCLSNS